MKSLFFEGEEQSIGHRLEGPASISGEITLTFH